MPDFSQTRGFQDAWRNQRPQSVAAQTDRASFKPTRQASHSRSISTAEKAKLARVVRKAPEVLVRVGRATSKTKAGAARPTTSGGEAVRFGNRLTYVTRNDKIELETSDGSIIATAEDRRDLAQEWIGDQAEYRDAGTASERTRMYRSIILSMPPGTDPVSVQDAARAFAKEEFAGHKWIMALHTDTDHPHVHLDVQTVRDDGHKLSPGKADLERYRDEFASQLRTLGIEAEATPRHARGVPQHAPNPELYRARDRQEHPENYRWPGPRAEPRTDAALRERVEANPSSATVDRPGDIAARDRRNGVIETYLAAADELRRGSKEDCALAIEVASFVAEMPAYTPRLHLAAHEAQERISWLPGRGVVGGDVNTIRQPPQAQEMAFEKVPTTQISEGLQNQLFAAVYTKPEQAAERWTALVDVLGADRAFDRLRTTPETLGSLQGWRMLGMENVARKDASERFGDLITGLRAELNAQAKQGLVNQAQVVGPPAIKSGEVPLTDERNVLSQKLADLVAERERLSELKQDAASRIVETSLAASTAPTSQANTHEVEKELKPIPPVRRDRPHEPDMDR